MLTTYSQLAGGVFSGKYKSKSEVPTEGRFADTASSGKVSWVVEQLPVLRFDHDTFMFQ